MILSLLFLLLLLLLLLITYRSCLPSSNHTNFVFDVQQQQKQQQHNYALKRFTYDLHSIYIYTYIKSSFEFSDIWYQRNQVHHLEETKTKKKVEIEIGVT